MSAGVTALVLFSALMHASWNALVKSGRDPVLNTALVVGAMAVLAAPVLPFLPLPAAASWPYLLGSVVVHQIYFTMVAAAYRHGDLSFTYPLMRGLPPLLVTCAGSLLLDDETPASLWLGVAAVSFGVLWIGGFARMVRHAHLRPTLIALANAVMIAAYTLIDGLGVRASDNPLAYTLWLILLSSLLYVASVYAGRKHELHAHVHRYWPRALIAAALSIGAYSIALWAMTVAPIAAVSALRETSVIFAAMIGALLLKEPFGRHRIAGACVVAAGIALIKL